MVIPFVFACRTLRGQAVTDMGGAPTATGSAAYLNVVETTDFNGESTIQILSSAELADLRKAVDLDNKAMSRAYRNLKDRALDKIRQENEARRRQYYAQNSRGHANLQPIHFKSYDFPMDEPTPRSVQLLGRYQDPAQAQKTKERVEAQEAVRKEMQAKGQAPSAFDSAPQGKFKKVQYKKKERDAVPAELVKALQEEYEKIKKQMEADPVYAASNGRKSGVNSTTSDIQPKLPTRRLGDPRSFAPISGPSGGRRLGEQTN